MKKIFSNKIVAQQFEKANVWQKCEMVIVAFCEFLYLFVMTVLSIVKKIVEYLQQFLNATQEKHDHTHHCEQVQQIQQSLQQLLEQQNKQQLLLQSILDYIKLSDTEQMEKLRKQFERQWNKPIINDDDEDSDSE